MTDSSPNLTLPYIMAAQAQKHVTHNEAIRALDAIVQLSVIDRDLTVPPPSLVDGDRYIVAAGASGSWSGHDDEIAAFQDGAWMFYAPAAGWLAWVDDEDALVAWDGSGWAPAGGSVNPTPLVGVNTTADATNRLSVSSAATLFNHDGSGHQQKINKAAAGDTASTLFQTGFSGRAEMGLAGDDDFHVKVSADGINWHEAIVVDRTTGLVRFPTGSVRERLQADRTYFVRTDGDDANAGLTNNAGGAFLTIQRAIDFVYGELDLATYDVTIQVGIGTYAENLQITAPPLGSGRVILSGDIATPANVVIAGTSHCLLMSGGWIDIRGFQLNPGTGRHGLNMTDGQITFRNLDFGATTGSHIVCIGSGLIQGAGAGYTISGGAARHILSSRGGQISVANLTVTLNGTPAFAAAYAFAEQTARVLANGCTFTGTATGKRYQAQTNAVIETRGGGATYFPGDVAGVTPSGGQYS